MPKGKHNNHRSGRKHYRWNDGRMLSSHGYVKIRVGKGHPLADSNGYAYEHLAVWVEAGNARPARGMVLHHINGDKTDNRIENLRIMNRGLHIMDEHAVRDASTGRLVSKSLAGRLLDGVEHNGFPEVK